MRPVLRLLLIAMLAGLPAFAAEPADREIEFLIGYVEQSGVHFIRSGKEYSAQEGADHLRAKLKRAGSRVHGAEQFIEAVASKSYLTGEPYQVKLPDGQTSDTGPWLSAALRKHRASGAR